MPREILFNEDEVLKKVVDIFWQKGYNGTSMQDLASVTGLNRSSIYNSFGSKINLYKLALKIYQKTTESNYQKVLLESDNSKAAIYLFFDKALKSLNNKNFDKGCFIINSTIEMSQKNTSIKEVLQDSQENAIQFLTALIKDAQESGSVNKKDTSSNYAYYLYTSLQGLKISAVLMDNPLIFKKMSHTILKILD